MSEQTKPETWRAVAGWESYEVSSLGRVRSIDRTIVRPDGTTQTRAGVILAQQKQSAGYSCVTLWRLGRKKTVLVHRLVAEAFLEGAHTTETVNHKDGCKANNAAQNLAWATLAENHKHAEVNGLFASGERHGHAKLREIDVIDSRRRRREGDSLKSLARRFGVSVSAMDHAVSGRTWSHLPLAPEPHHEP